MEKTKKIITLLIIIICIFSISTISNATNEEIEIVKGTNQYMIYLKEYSNSEFEFAFSNNKNAKVTELSFKVSALDRQGEGANKIAYVESSEYSMFTNPTYMWVTVNDEVKISAMEVKLDDNITTTELQNIETISKKIPVKIEQKQVLSKENEEGTKITETIGIATIAENITNGKYQIVERKATEDTDKLFALAELIEKNEFADGYTQIKTNKEFLKTYNKHINDLKEENWKTIENYTIEQPREAKTGDQYILYVKAGNNVDTHFLTSYREFKEEYIKEQVTTILPHTYDNNTILIVLGIVVVAIVLVTIRIVILKRKGQD